MERLCSGIVLEARALGISYLSRGPLDLHCIDWPRQPRAQDLQFPEEPAGGSTNHGNLSPGTALPASPFLLEELSPFQHSVA